MRFGGHLEESTFWSQATLEVLVLSNENGGNTVWIILESGDSEAVRDRFGTTFFDVWALVNHRIIVFTEREDARG